MRAWLVLLLVPLAGCFDAGDDPPTQAADDDSDVPAGCDLLSAPGDVGQPVATPGPGPGMTTITWGPVAGAVSYVLYRDGTPLRLGNTVSFGDHAALARSYEVAAVDVCGNEGARSPAATGTPLPGSDLLAVGALPHANVRSDEIIAWPAVDAHGNATGTSVSWRIVEGTGNCCENYVITTPTGRIIDFGGTYLHYSDDEGARWKTVGTIPPYGTGEGAVVVGPGGDVLAAGWDPYSGDQLWSHKYVAADDQWYYQHMPLHQPFYDRAWITAVKGPFTINGMTVPYLTFVESNFHGGTATLLLRSNDGLHYAEFTESGLDIGGEVSGILPDRLEIDPDRDWMQPISQSPSRPLGQGLGLQQATNALAGDCHWRLLHEDGSYSCPPGPLGDLPRNQPVLADSLGNLHHFDRGARVYRMSTDMGASWHEVGIPWPENWRVNDDDQKVSAALDQTIWAFHLNVDTPNGTITGDLLVRFRDVTTQPVLDEMLQIGSWDSGSDSGLGGSRRYDFMTTGFLPDGRAVLSFTDAEHHPPALAVEQLRGP